VLVRGPGAGSPKETALAGASPPLRGTDSPRVTWMTSVSPDMVLGPDRDEPSLSA